MACVIMGNWSIDPIDFISTIVIRKMLYVILIDAEMGKSRQMREKTVKSKNEMTNQYLSRIIAIAPLKHTYIIGLFELMMV